MKIEIHSDEPEQLFTVILTILIAGNNVITNGKDVVRQFEEILGKETCKMMIDLTVNVSPAQMREIMEDQIDIFDAGRKRDLDI